ncbi:MAG TPA: polysaccharide pyruvyl transferase CsaB [Syntrophomonas sp.]|nr:polysaccharide pyruvyl transferase CsaB [Syntrophomonas sp.]
MKIALSGYYGFDNAGDEALLLAIRSSLESLAPDCEFVVFSGNPAKTRRLHNIRAVYNMNPWAVARELLTSDLLISGGGSIFQDVTSSRSLLYYISVVLLARMLGKPVVFYAQGVGPIRRSFNRWLLGRVADRVNLITLRDQASRDFMHRLGVNKPPIKVTADPVFALQANEDSKADMLRRFPFLNGDTGKCMGVSVRHWPALQGYQQNLAVVLDYFARSGLKVIFVPMDYPADIKESELVASYMKEEYFLLSDEMTTEQHLALICNLDLMVGMRLHALIFAASCDVPFTGISYDPKIDAFLDLFGKRPLTGETDLMIAQIEEQLYNQAAREQFRAQAEKMRVQSRENARLTLEVVPKSARRV